MKLPLLLCFSTFMAWTQTCHALFVPVSPVTIGKSFFRVATTALFDAQDQHRNRRTFLNNDIPKLFAPVVLATSLIKKSPVSAAIMDTNTPGASTFKPGQTIGVEEAKNRFILAIKEVDELIENYDEISKGGNGDNVRRYLGTVGVKSHMYGISKVLRELRDEVDDIVEFTETIADFESYLFQAEGAAYQSLFVEYSSAKGSPETFLATAKKDIIVMRKYMGDLAKQLNLDL